MTPHSKELAALLVYISDWLLEHRIGSGIVHDSPEAELKDSIFVNGNYVRVLLCTYELTHERDYLNEAIAWCDHFVNVQAMSVRTSKGNEAVWWWTFNH